MANKQTIKPKVVPFEIAKLLKEVGYDEKVENPDLALRKRLDKEQKGEDAPDGFSNVIEIKGDDAKKLVETLCGILRKDK